MRPFLAAALAIGSLAAPGVAGAQVPTQDSVTGSGVARGGGTVQFDFQIDARSGPSGENPSGQVSFHFRSDGSLFFEGPVTCLSVSGNVAVLNVLTQGFGTVGMEVTDSPSGDLIRAIPTSPTPPCPSIGAAVDFPVLSGDLVVVDAPALPTSTEQCRNGGWRAYGVFKNQGDCVSFVVTGEKNSP